MSKRHLITSALPYANGPIHIGHVAGCLLPADIHNRFLKLKGEDVLFVCGTDEHGVPITLKAKNENKTPQEVVDENHALIKKALVDFGISFDHFSRTTNGLHHQTSQEFFKTLYDKGVFIEEVNEQLYDEEAGQFLADRYIIGTCPNCGNENAYGDQCEKCGKTLSPSELINPRSALTGNKPILKSTKNWFLPLDKIQNSFLNNFIEEHKGVWRSSVYGQCKSWLKEGLRPRAMTRDLDWGVKVPIEGAEGKVMYVWFDAPIGYITATKEAAGDDWEKWWKDSDTQLTHFLGKDNIVFHCIIFPAMLHEHGEFILPTHVPANEFLNLEGQKISTSRNHAIWLHEYLEDFPEKRDELRYVLSSILPETKDADFTWKDYQAKVNNELVAILGNFVNRVIVLTQKYYNGHVPQGILDPYIQKEMEEISSRIEGQLYKFEQREANFSFMELARTGNKYLQETAPWHLVKEAGTEQQVADCMYSCLLLLKQIAKYASIFLPDTSIKLLNALNINNFNDSLIVGNELGETELLFQKVEDDTIAVQLEKLNTVKQENTLQLPKFKEMINYDDFTKLDLRVGTVKTAEKVEKADKLLKLTVDIGSEVRTVVSGIAEHFSPEDIMGVQVCILVNLAPRKLKGIESQGMILMAEDSDGSLRFLSPAEATSAGSVIS